MVLDLIFGFAEYFVFRKTWVLALLIKVKKVALAIYLVLTA